MQKIWTIILLSVTLLIMGCAKEPTLCEPLKAVELLINNPRLGPSKTETNFYTIVSEDDKYVYLGYYTLNWKLERILDPFYKTPKEKFYQIQNNLILNDKRMAMEVIRQWIISQYPKLSENLEINVAQTLKITVVYNERIQKYDLECDGWIDFYTSKMEKSTIKGVDAMMVNHSIKKLDYSCVISENNYVTKMKMQDMPIEEIEVKK